MPAAGANIRALSRSDDSVAEACDRGETTNLDDTIPVEILDEVTCGTKQRQRSIKQSNMRESNVSYFE